MKKKISFRDQLFSISTDIALQSLYWVDRKLFIILISDYPGCELKFEGLFSRR